MKKLGLIFVVCLLLTLSVCITSCEPDKSPSMRKVAGTYYLYIDELEEDTFLKINSDGTGEYCGNSAEIILDDNTITITTEKTTYIGGIRSGVIHLIEDDDYAAFDKSVLYFCKEGISSPFKAYKNIRYSVGIDGNYEITEILDKNITEFEIPTKIDRVAVTGLGPYIFEECENLNSIIFPKSLKKVRDDAFYNCRQLSKVIYKGDIYDWCAIDFGSNAANPIMYSAGLYINNELITELKLQERIQKIGRATFYGYNHITRVTIPDSVTEIGVLAFGSCVNLSDVVIGKGLTNITNSAFWYCDRLKEIVIPDNITCIEWGAFYGCSSLEKITIGKGVTSIGECAFEGCRYLSNIFYNGTKEQWEAIEKGKTWDRHVGDYSGYTVHCSDGDIAKDSYY